MVMLSRFVALSVSLTRKASLLQNGGGGYTDSYNASFSNDLEPTSLTECGNPRRPGDVSCGGWGFYWLNLLATSVRLVQAASEPVQWTQLFLQSPRQDSVFSAGATIALNWTSMGAVRPGQQFAVELDRATVAVVQQTSFELTVKPAGEHSVGVTAVGAASSWPLSRTQLDASAIPGPARAETTIYVGVPRPPLPPAPGPPPAPAPAPSTPAVASSFEGHLALAAAAMSSPCVVLESAAFHLFFSSGPAKVLHSVSTDGQTWAPPNPVAVRGKQPAVVRFAGLWRMIVACEVGLCAATAKAIDGPWTAARNPIWHAQPGQLLSEPSAVLSSGSPTELLVYCTLTEQEESGSARIVAGRTNDGVSVVPSHRTVYGAGNADIKWDRRQRMYVLIQGDGREMTWSSSTDGISFQAVDRKHRVVASGPALSPTAPCLAGMSDGSFPGDTFAVFASGSDLLRSKFSYAPAVSNCSSCAAFGCDFACCGAVHGNAHGWCRWPGSRSSGNCCVCGPAE